MEWSKIKTILIYILLFVNLLLIGLYWGAGFDERASEIQIVEDVYGVINRSGISIGKSTIPFDSKNVAFYRATRDLQFEKDVASRLVGEYDETAISFKSGNIISASFHKPMATIDLIASQLNVDLQQSKTDQAIGSGTKYTQMVNNLPVLNCTVNISLKNQLVTINGHLILSKIDQVQNRESLYISDLLLTLVDQIIKTKSGDTEIQSITPALMTETVATGDIIFVPVWQVKTDKTTYTINAQTKQINTVNS